MAFVYGESVACAIKDVHLVHRLLHKYMPALYNSSDDAETCATTMAVLGEQIITSDG